MGRTVKVGYIGLGRRGFGVLKRNVAKMKDVEVVMICDLVEERLEKGRQAVIERSGKEPLVTTNYKDVINHPDIEAVFIMIGWSGRPAMAIESMRAGKYTAIEVGCADTLEECFDLVKAYEETGVPVMMMENCCYDRREMAAYNVVEQGELGEIVHCTGAYMHYLNDCELFKDIDTEEPPHYRLGKYQSGNRESYPTHALGPISKILKVNRGNLMTRLVSVSSKSCGLKDYAARHIGADSKYANIDYNQGDIVDTIITCAGGETIHLTLDTTLPRHQRYKGLRRRGA